MKSILPILALAVATAAVLADTPGGAPAPANPPRHPADRPGLVPHAINGFSNNGYDPAPGADRPLDQEGTVHPDPRRLVQEAAETAARHRWIEARVRQQAELFGRQVVGSGIYLQDADGRQPRLRVELRMQSGGQTSSVLRVCDGRYWWNVRESDGTTTVARVDLVQLRRMLAQQAAAKQAAAEQGATDQAAADQATTDQSTAERAGDAFRPRPLSPDESLALGGLAKLFEGLIENFDFHDAQRSQLDRLPVWVIRGRWSAEKLAELLPDGRPRGEAAARRASLDRLPDHLPHEVVLYLGADNLFPYRIDFRRTVGGEGDAATRSIAAMEFFEISLAGPIASNRFEFQPGETLIHDETGKWLERLGR